MIIICSACSGGKVKKDKPADTVYSEAMNYYERKRYDDAIAAFQEVTTKYPMSRYAADSRLKIADSHYMNESYPEAISAYREFEKLHPTNENIPYAAFQVGMSYFNQMLTIDRDQTAAFNAAVEFSRLIGRFPESSYRDDAKKNLDTARKSLAENEFYVGHFYFRKKNYKAAVDRFDYVINNYPEFPSMDKVLFYAGKANIELNEREKGKELLERLLKDYPGSKFARGAKGMLESD